MASPTKSPLERLPLEMRLAILCELPDIRSLGSTLLTCRALWEPYLQAPPSKIIDTILFSRQLDVDGVRCQAIATWRLLQLPRPAPRQPFYNFLDDFLKSETQHIQPFTLNLGQAFEIEKFHNIVRELANDFASDCLADAADRFNVTQRAVTTHERTQIMRAFYLTEIYLSIIRGQLQAFVSTQPMTSGLSLQHLASWEPKLFLEHLASWEHEILNCITFYLYRRTTQCSYLTSRLLCYQS